MGIKVCTYDNPATMARECWQDGRLICHYQAGILPPYAKWQMPIPQEYFFLGANIGPWKLGQIVGDAEAMLAKPTHADTVAKIKVLTSANGAVNLSPC